MPEQDPTIRALPVELDNWQVWDIDGLPVGAAEEGEAMEAPHIPDRPDKVLVASIPERRWRVEPGNAVALPVTVLNNSTRRMTVRAHLEGWLDDRWVVEPYLQAAINPGERRTLELTVAPPRQPGAEAGDYHLAIVVRSSDEPARTARLGVVLTLLAYDRVLLDLADLPTVAASWWRRTLPLAVRVANEGNHAVALRLEGATPAQIGHVTFAGSGGDAAAEIVLRPGQRLSIPARLAVRRLPWFALGGRTLPFSLAASDAQGKTIQQVRGSVEVRPLIGFWQLASLAGLAMAGAAAMLLFVVLGALFLRISAAAPQAATSLSAPAPAVIVVALNQPMTAATSTSGPSAAAPSLASAIQGQPDPSLPLVLPDQVTAPGSGGPARTILPPADDTAGAPVAEHAPVAPAGSASMTYAQMFQSVGAQYDLDWRMLAAQAYIESGFDTLALSSAGAMGLMQVLPSTWREWAPTVNASDPFDSYSNVQVAAVYLDYLRTQLARSGHPEKEWMLVAYNWGLDHVNDFLTGGSAWQDLPEARRQYAEDILRIAQTLP